MVRTDTHDTPAPRWTLRLIASRIHGKLLFLPASVALAAAVRRRSRPTELWIGDSHAMSANRAITNSMFMRAPEGQLILRAGARLMFSLARDGFPPRIMRVCRLVHGLVRPGALIPVFSAGEIDVRVHLPRRPEAPLDFVDRYVERCVQVAGLLKADRVGFFVPPPPVDVAVEDMWFPHSGSIHDRLAAHARLRAALRDAVARVPGAVLLDLTDVLADASGAMPAAYSVEGVHTNLAAVALIRRRLAEDRLLAA